MIIIASEVCLFMAFSMARMNKVSVQLKLNNDRSYTPLLSSFTKFEDQTKDAWDCADDELIKTFGVDPDTSRRTAKSGFIFFFSLTFKIQSFRTEHTETKNSSDSKLQVVFICSVRIINIFFSKTSFSGKKSNPNQSKY